MDDKYLYSYTLHYPVLVAEGVSSTAKLLYSIIWPLTTKYGFAWPSNEYLAKPLGITVEGVRKCMRQLEDKGLIVTEVTNENGKTVRKIWCTLPREETPTNGGVAKATTTSVPHRPQLLSQSTPTKVVDHIEDECEQGIKQVEEAATKSKTQVEARTDGYILASALLKLIRRNKKFYSRIARYVSPEKEENTLCGWARDFDRLLTLDSIPFDEAVEVLKWCQNDEFWQGQILSGGKFRKQFETLKNQMNGGSHGRFMEPDDHPEITEKIIATYGWLINNSKWKPQRYQVQKFIEAAERVVAFIDIHNDRGLSVDELIGYLRDCLQEHYREKGDMVHPGNMKSDYTWDVLLPQYLENVIGAL